MPNQRDQMRRFIERVGEPVTVAEIMQALDYHYDETMTVCAQLKMMSSRGGQPLSRVLIKGRWAYFMRDKLINNDK